MGKIGFATATAIGSLMLAFAATEGASLKAQADQKATEIVSKLTLDEKVNQLINVAPAIPRLGIPAYNWWTESLHGAIGALPATNFPEPVGLAATFDAPLVKDVAAVISEENRGLHALARQTGHLGTIGTGLDTWSPNINLYRDPRWGRGQETYGEDPFLTAKMGVAYVQGMQGNPETPDIIATPKHYAVHSGPESTRHHANVFVSPHDLEDTYLPAFRAAIVEGKAGSIMCAYNRIDGQPACANDLLMTERLRKSWGFEGYVVSDCDAVKDIADNHKYAPDQAAAVAAALKQGVDNECNGDTLSGAGPVVAARYKEALAKGYISVGDIDQALVRLFSARYRNGDLKGLDRPNQRPARIPLITPEHTSLALTASEKSLVLLKNDGTLPLQPSVKIAVVGPLADSTRVLRGNYSAQQTGTPVSVLAGLKKAMPGAKISYAPFSPSYTDGDSVPESALQTPDGKPGLKAEYYNATSQPPAATLPYPERMKQMAAMKYGAKPSVTQVEPNIAARGNSLAKVSTHHKVVWTGFLVPPESGTYRIALTGFMGEMVLDGKSVAKLDRPAWGGLPNFTNVTLEKGRKYPLKVTTEAHGLSGIDMLWQRVSDNADADLAKVTSDADVVVAVVGLTASLEGEEMPVKIEGFNGGDKTSLDLPADQRAMLEKIRASGKKLVVVAMNGSPIALQWAKENVAAIVESWYAGEKGGEAIANVLSGKTNPAGRLPLTFYTSIADLPPFDDYSMKGRTYRYFTGTPVYSFGYGLSYTTFSYAPLKVEAVGGNSENGITVTTEVTNTGAREGDEVAQLYLTPPPFEGAPRLALRGFSRLSLKPGEHKTVSFTLTPRDMSFVASDGTRQVFAGQYGIAVGSAQPQDGIAHQKSSVSVAKAVSIPQ